MRPVFLAGVLTVGLMAALLAADVGSLSKGESATPPTVELQVSIAQPSIMRDQTATAAIIVLNKSNSELTELSVQCLNPKFTAGAKLENMKAFGSQQGAFNLRAAHDVDFGEQRLPIYLEYNWSAAGKTFRSAQTTVASVTVTRQFEEEAKGLPGGSGALLYLLLPIMPAFLAFEVTNSLRKGEGWKMPTFKSDYVLPAFLLGLGVSFLVLLFAKQQIDFAYSDPVAFACMLGGSLVVGAAPPAARWLAAAVRFSLDGFAETDSEVIYIQKALRLNSKAIFPWVTEVTEGPQWRGFLLHQPNGEVALGAQILLSPRGALPDVVQLRSLFNSAGQLTDAKKLKGWLRDGLINVDFKERIQKDQKSLAAVVITDGLETLSNAKTENRCLIAIVS
jgi:hypothetical protein